MSHEKGIEAATEVISAEHAYQISYEAVLKGIKAYLDASGMVMVSKGDPKMESAAWQVMKVFYKDKASKDASDEILQQAIAAAPNPFQTPEESREKK